MVDGLVLAGADLALALANPRAIRHFHHAHKRIPRPAVPGTYAERMLWRKLVDHNPRFVELSDKLACKAFVQRRCPELAVPETLWVGDDADDIPDDVLDGDVFVKTNHGFNQNYVVRGGRVDRADLKSVTDGWLRSVHGLKDYQWAYREVQPKLFVERSIGNAGSDLLEINIRASDGRPLLGSVIGHNKLPNQWTVYLDLDGRATWGPGSLEGDPPEPLPVDVDIEGPYRDAVAHCAQLSRGIDYARYDFMWNGRTLYAGEITIYPNRGRSEIDHPAARRLLMDGWRLETADFLTRPHRGLRGMYAAALRRRLQRDAADPADPAEPADPVDPATTDPT